MRSILFLNPNTHFKEFSRIFRLNARKFSESFNHKPLNSVKLAYNTYLERKPLFQELSTPLIIHHGLLGSKQNWTTLSKRFRDLTEPSREIVVIDCRNHGESPHTDTHSYPHLVADVKLLMEELKFKRISFLGHSMGGRVGIMFALKYVRIFLVFILFSFFAILCSFVFFLLIFFIFQN